MAMTAFTAVSCCVPIKTTVLS